MFGAVSHFECDTIDMYGYIQYDEQILHKENVSKFSLIWDNLLKNFKDVLIILAKGRLAFNYSE